MSKWSEGGRCKFCIFQALEEGKVNVNECVHVRYGAVTSEISVNKMTFSPFQ